MSWLFFQDESGHDHKNMPLEVRGGVAIHASRIWDFVKAMQKAEEDCVGQQALRVGYARAPSRRRIKNQWRQAFSDEESTTCRAITPRLGRSGLCPIQCLWTRNFRWGHRQQTYVCIALIGDFAASNGPSRDQSVTISTRTLQACVETFSSLATPMKMEGR